ncbi:MAG TPA: gamma-glutamyl-gamma-aminobutyrate hydrolase family protein, partial [Herpetosiphonaceae bacterium]|nr:gamma-glutamyl-gamma-aminobutyrate hydrolase family protein [Herpetosiphonaceae bacterium]
MPASSSTPVIGIPCASYDLRPVPYPLIHGNNETYVRAIEQVGGVPLLVPLMHSERALRAAFERLDGLLLAG